MVAPQVLTCRAVGQAILDHDAHGQVHHPVGVMTPGWGHVREVQAEVRVARRTLVLRRGDDQVPWTPGVEIAQIMPRALLALVAIGVAPTTRTGVVGGVATAVKKLWLGSIRRARDAFRGIGPVYAGSWHTGVLRDNHGGASHIRRTVLACLHTTRFLYYSVELRRF
jgi:hypothetical protein